LADQTILEPSEETDMSHLRVTICRVEDDAQPGKATELHSFDLPPVDADKMRPETALDQMEDGVLRHGQEIMRMLLEQEWVEVDKQLAERYEQAFPPRDGDS
jgi:hypothetical protein